MNFNCLNLTLNFNSYHSCKATNTAQATTGAVSIDTVVNGFIFLLPANTPILENTAHLTFISDIYNFQLFIIYCI